MTEGGRMSHNDLVAAWNRQPVFRVIHRFRWWMRGVGISLMVLVWWLAH